MLHPHIHSLKYPRLLLLASMYFVAIVLYLHGSVHDLITVLNNGGYAAVLIAGMFFSFGLTAPFATVALLELGGSVDLWPAALIGGIAATMTDLILFRAIRSSMRDEITRFLSYPRRLFRWRGKQFHALQVAQKYLKWSAIGMIMISPAPDEIALSLLSETDEPDERILALVCLFMNIASIALLLSASALL